MNGSYQTQLFILIHHEIQILFLNNYLLKLFCPALNGNFFKHERVLYRKPLFSFLRCKLHSAKCQTTAIGSYIFTTIQVRGLHNHWLEFLLHVFHLKFSFFSATFLFYIYSVGSLRWNSHNPRKSNCCHCQQLPKFKLVFLHNYRCDLFHWSCNGFIFVFLKEHEVWRTINPVPEIEIW